MPPGASGPPGVTRSPRPFAPPSPATGFAPIPGRFFRDGAIFLAGVVFGFAERVCAARCGGRLGLRIGLNLPPTPSPRPGALVVRRPLVHLRTESSLVCGLARGKRSPNLRRFLPRWSCSRWLTATAAFAYSARLRPACLLRFAEAGYLVVAWSPVGGASCQGSGLRLPHRFVHFSAVWVAAVNANGSVCVPVGAKDNPRFCRARRGRAVVPIRVRCRWRHLLATRRHIVVHGNWLPMNCWSPCHMAREAGSPASVAWPAAVSMAAWTDSHWGMVRDTG